MKNTGKTLFFLGTSLLILMLVLSNINCNKNSDTTTYKEPGLTVDISNSIPGVGETVTINGTASDGLTPYTTLFTLEVRPFGSAATISSVSDFKANVVPDVAGLYTVSLKLTDAAQHSVIKEISFEAFSYTVKAIIDGDKMRDIGEVVPFDASASEPQNSGLAFAWSMIEVPLFSNVTTASIPNPNSFNIGFIMDEPGTYSLELLVELGADSDRDTVQAISNPPVISGLTPESGIEESEVIISGKNFSSNINGLIVKFNGVVATVLQQSYSELTVQVPIGATTGPVTVTLSETGEEAVSATDFVVQNTFGWRIVHETWNRLQDVDFVDQLNGMAVGAEGKIFRTSDGGNTWTEMNSPTDEELYDISWVSQTTAYAVGYGVSPGGIVIKSSNGGTTWQILQTPANDYLYCVDFIDENKGYVGGSSVTLLYTEDGGLTWEDRAPNYGSYKGLFFFDENVGFATGSSCIWRTLDGGLTWAQPQNGYYNLIYYSPYFISPNEGWVAGGVSSILLEGHIAYTINGGANYNSISNGIQHDFYDIMFLDASNGYTVGDAGTILRTTDGGINWIHEIQSSDYKLWGLYVLNTNEAVAVGQDENKGIILKRN